MTRSIAPGDVDLAHAQERHALEAHVARGDGRELGVEVVGHREDAVDDVVGVSVVAVEHLAHELLGRVEDLLARRCVRRGGAAQGVQAHGGREATQWR